MKKQFIINALLFFTVILYCQSQENKSIDSVSFPRQKKLQEFVDLLVKNKYIVFNEKKLFYYDMLEKQEKAKDFALNLALIHHPKSKYFIEKYFQISEDKTKKLWFVVTRLGEPGKVMDGELCIIFSKNDGQVFQLTNHF